MEGRERLMLHYLAAWNARDADRIASFFTEDAAYEDRGAGAVLHGRAAIEAHAARVHGGFGDLVRAASALSSARRRVAPRDGRRTTPGSG